MGIKANSIPEFFLLCKKEAIAILSNHTACTLITEQKVNNFLSV